MDEAVKFVVLFVLSFLLIFVELWLWRLCVTPVTGWPVPSYWQMYGIDALVAIVRFGSHRCSHDS